LKKAEMRLQFNDSELKGKLEDLAAEVELSLNALANMILAAPFSEGDRKKLQLLLDIAEFKRSIA
jgi:hypothetical protein